MKKSFNFEKYHGIGNDFIFISHAYLKKFKSIAELKNFSVKICHRNYGIGADGVIFYRIAKLKKLKRFEMLIVNSDGSFGATCGNALRCFGLKLFREKEWNGKKASSVFRLDISKKNKDILSQEELFVLDTQNPFSTLLKVEAYQKHQDLAKISILFDLPQKITFFKKDLTIKPQDDTMSLRTWFGGQSLSSCDLTAAFENPVFVQLENPHLVFLSRHFENLTNEQCIQLGKEIQKQVNANISFLALSEKMDTGKTQFSLRVFERGAGLTMGCGSGAVACALALRFTEHISNTENSVSLKMLGGDVKVLLPKDMNEKITLCANAQFVFQGDTNLV